ncbi:MAG: DUF4249 domain-containing protein [Bacteroidetes bacterium]|nr:DUF4249 domain-containing protein [Bacteroidota bacterium]
MKKSVLFTLVICIITFFTSCEDVIQIKLDEGSKLYVIDAFVNNLREDQKIRVITNDNYFSNKEAPPVTNALVILEDATTGQQYTFNYQSNGYYVYPITALDTIAKLNHNYRLKVTIEGHTYTSTAAQKRTAILDTIIAGIDQGAGFGPASKDSAYNCLLYARDIADNKPDYYWIKTFRNDTLFAGSGEINICIDGTGGVVIDAPQDTIKFTPPSTLLSFKQYKKYNTCKVQIHSLSRENYFFFIQMQLQINNGGLFATTPENVKTNIITPEGARTKAVGRFNMASVVEKKIIVK